MKQLLKWVKAMSSYEQLSDEQQKEVDLRVKLLFGLCHKDHPLKDSLMHISREINSTLVKIQAKKLVARAPTQEEQ